MVAALLDLHHGAGAAVEAVDEMRRHVAHGHDVADLHRRQRRVAFRLQLFLVAEHLGDAG